MIATENYLAVDVKKLIEMEFDTCQFEIVNVSLSYRYYLVLICTQGILMRDDVIKLGELIQE